MSLPTFIRILTFILYFANDILCEIVVGETCCFDFSGDANSQGGQAEFSHNLPTLQALHPVQHEREKVCRSPPKLPNVNLGAQMIS